MNTGWFVPVPSADGMIDWLARKADAGMIVTISKVGNRYSVEADKRYTGETLYKALEKAVRQQEDRPVEPGFRHVLKPGIIMSPYKVIVTSDKMPPKCAHCGIDRAEVWFTAQFLEIDPEIAICCEAFIPA